MISSIKNQNLKETIIVSSTVTTENPKQHLVEGSLIMPLNDDDSNNNSFKTSMIATSTVSSLHQNLIDSKLVNNCNNNNNNNNNNNINNNSNSNNNIRDNNNCNNINFDNNCQRNAIILASTEIKVNNNLNTNDKINNLLSDNTNLFNLNNIKTTSMNKDIKYINGNNNYNSPTSPTTMLKNSSINSTISPIFNDTQNLFNNKININNNNNDNNTTIDTFKMAAIPTITTTNNNINGDSNDNTHINNTNNTDSKISVNSTSTIPINNAKDFINSNTNVNSLIQQPLKQEIVANDLVTTKNICNKNNDSEHVITSNSSILSITNSSPVKNGLKSSNQNNINNKSALFNTSNNSVCRTSTETTSIISKSLIPDLNRITSLSCNKDTKLQSTEGIKLLTTADISSSKLLSNFKISTFNKLPDLNKTVTATNTANTTIMSNSNNTSVVGNSMKTSTSNGLKPVGFISLEQNGWNLNFITTTSLVPSTSTATTSSTTKFEISQAPTKTTTINSSFNNRFNNLNDTLTKNKLSASNANNAKNIISNQVNSTIVNRSLIEDVHNYSKKSKRFPAECISTTNSSVEESEEDDDPDDDNDDDDVDYEENGEDISFCSNEFDYRKFSTTNNNNKNKKPFQTSKIESTINTECGSGAKIMNYKIKNIIEDQNNISENKDDIIKKEQHEINFDTFSTNEDNKESSLTPEHHARRPMNAFLIFCKRHRAIVRDKYKNVENRQVTKILGEWWENMSQDEKSCYTNLAKEYKDAFLSANPNFKWYKLPAPPLRTLTTRPLNMNVTSSEDNSTILSKNQLPSKLDNVKIRNEPVIDDKISPIMISKKNDDHTESGNVGVFKLADETQMGGLSSLLTGNSSPNGNNSPDINKSVKSENRSTDHEDLQCALSETSQFISLAMPKTKPDLSNLEPFERMRNHAQKMQMSLKNNKRKISELDSVAFGAGGKKFIRDSSFSSSEEDNWLRKPTRSCKGKIYQELISSGQISTSSKKNKKTVLMNNFAQSNFIKSNTNNKESSSDSDGAIITQAGISNDSSSPLKDDSKYTSTDNLSNIIKESDIKIELSEDYQITEPCLNGSTKQIDVKPFDTNAFDLETKIMALPAQDLEDYLQKKQESKCKKKIASKRRKNFNTRKSLKSNNSNNNNMSISSQLPSPLSPSEMSNQMFSKSDEPQDINSQTLQLELFKEHIVGSQKRKARKESITRRDLNTTSTATLMTKNKPQMNWVDYNGVNIDQNKIEITNHNDIINADQIKYIYPQSQEIPSMQRHEHYMPSSHNQFFSQRYEPNIPEPASNRDLLILAEVASNFEE